MHVSPEVFSELPLLLEIPANCYMELNVSFPWTNQTLVWPAITVDLNVLSYITLLMRKFIAIRACISNPLSSFMSDPCL
jgi:hypothetical protein